MYLREVGGGGNKLSDAVSLCYALRRDTDHPLRSINMKVWPNRITLEPSFVFAIH